MKVRHSTEKEVEEQEVREEEEGKEKEEGCAGVHFSSSLDLNRAVSSSAATVGITSLEDEINGKESLETAA